MHHRYARWLLVLSMLVPAWVGAQEADEGEQGTDASMPFIDMLDVEVVNIDVWVSDKQGNSITGLTKEDFIVLRDGGPVEVTNFYAVAEGRPTTPSAPPVEELEAPELADRRGGLPYIDPIAPEHQLWLVIYIDNFNIQPLERNRIFPAIRQFIGSNLREGDQAMLVTYDRALEILEPFTSNRHRLQDALIEIIDDSGLASIRRRDLMSTLRRIDDSEHPTRALTYARQYAEEQMNNVEYTTAALQRLIDSLGGLPGRKALLHVSSGIPMAAGEAAFHAVAEKFGTSDAYAEIPRHDTTRSFERINRYANAHRVVFYTLDAGGLRGLEFGNAEYGGFVTPRLRSTLDSVVPEMLQAPLRLMALETGGQAILNQNEVLPALQKAAQDFRTFYSLGISAVGDDRGRYHEIEVKVPGRKGLRVRHRSGYRSKNVDTRVRESLRSALLYAHQANPDNIQISWGLAEPYGEDKYLLPIQLRVPLQDVVLLPVGEGRHEARLQLYVGAADGDGGISEIDTAPFGVRLADEHVDAAKKEALLHTHKLVLGPGRKMVGVAVLDVFGRESSIVTEPIQIGKVDPELDAGK